MNQLSSFYWHLLSVCLFESVCEVLCVILRFIYTSVVRLLLTYGPFYTNMTTCHFQSIHMWNKRFTTFQTKSGRQVSVSFKLLHNRKYQFITNLYQCDACGLASLTLSFLYQYQC